MATATVSKDDIPERDADAQTWWMAARKLRGTPLWKKFYYSYLKSDAWEAKKEKVFAEKGYECRARLERCGAVATQVHHKSYKNVGDEKISELEPVCGYCHKELHD